MRNVDHFDHHIESYNHEYTTFFYHLFIANNYGVLCSENAVTLFLHDSIDYNNNIINVVYYLISVFVFFDNEYVFVVYKDSNIDNYFTYLVVG